MQAITVQHMKDSNDLDTRFGPATSTVNGSTEVEYHITTTTKKCWVCPRGIEVHYGDPKRCGKLCRNAEDREEDDQYEEVKKITLISISKATVLDFAALDCEQ